MGTEVPQLLDALERNSGRHPGYRRAQARGICANGTFLPSGRVGHLTTAVVFSGPAVPVLARFSNSAGNPRTSDRAPVAHGMSVKFRPVDPAELDVVAIALPSFLAATPEQFIEAVEALRPDPGTGQPVPERVGAYVAAHPSTAAAFAASATTPPDSYAVLDYGALHTFRWIGPGGRSTPIRYRWEPVDAATTGRTAGFHGPDVLAQELGLRLAGEPVRFTLRAQLAGPTDDLDDPSVAWPVDREEVEVGDLVLDRLDPRSDTDPDLGFDPTRILPGLELSGDPLLHYRREAYAESRRRRASEV